jgi:hypothetical protein
MRRCHSTPNNGQAGPEAYTPRPNGSSIVALAGEALNLMT